MISDDYINAMFVFAEKRHTLALTGKTDDDILRIRRFTNIYCELDETTSIIRKATNELVYPRGILGALIRVLFNAPYTLRTIINYRETLATFIETGDFTDLLKVLRDYYCTMGREYHIKQPAGYEKMEGLLLIARNFRENAAWPATQEKIIAGEYSYKTVLCWLTEFRWIGNFLAGEIAYELSMQYPGKISGTNDFILCGNATLRGIARLHGKYSKLKWTGSHTTVTNWSQESVQGTLLTLLKYAHNQFSSHYYVDTEKWPRWRLREVARTLAEFDRYERYRLGQRHSAIGDVAG